MLPRFTKHTKWRDVSSSSMNSLVAMVKAHDLALKKKDRRSGFPAIPVHRVFVSDPDFDDVIECSHALPPPDPESPKKRKGRLGPRSTPVEIATFFVAKPYLLRRRPFDGDGKGRDSITYEYETGSERKATTTVTTIDDDGNAKQTELEEDQVVVPGYVKGDILYVTPTVFNPDGQLGKAEGNPFSNVTPTFVDLNADGRMWARA